MFIESKTWTGLGAENMAEVHAMIGPSLGKSPVAPPKSKREKSKSRRRQGKVRMFHSEKNYGFIRSGDDDFFFHISTAADPGLTFVMPGELVTFEAGEDKQGRAVAIRVVLA